MPNAFKYILLVLVLMLVGLNLYLCYLYFTGSGKLPEKKTLTGKILLGSQVEPQVKRLKIYCPDQYYLLTEGGNFVYLINPFTREEQGNASFFKDRYSKVEVVGEYGPASFECGDGGNSCACNDHLVVDDFNIIKDGKSFAQNYEGVLECSDAICDRLRLDDGRTYYISGFFGSFNKNDKVRVLGIIDETSPPPDANGIIDIFETSGI